VLLTLVASICPAGASPVVAGTPSPREPLYLAALFREPTSLLPRREERPARQERVGYWDGVPDEKLLERIRKQEIVKVTFNRGGSSLSLRLFLADGSSAAFKPDQIHEQSVPRKEIAAYRLNRLLGLARVPPATCRVVDVRTLMSRLAPEDRHLAFRIRKEARPGRDGRLSGEVSWWLPDISYWPIDRWKVRTQWHHWLKAYHDLPPEKVERAGQFATMLLFDYLINNPDRFTGYNTMGSPDGRFLYFMDNTFSFAPQPIGGWGARSGLERLQRFPVRLYRRLRALTEARIRAEFAREKHASWPLLTEQELRAVISRRNHALDHLHGIVARFGWEKTMVFP
jgi:hypothetical protein